MGRWRAGRQLRPGLAKALNPVIGGIGGVDGAATVRGDAVGTVELALATAAGPGLAGGRADLEARCSAGNHIEPERAQEGAIGPVDRDAVVVGVRDDQVPGGVNADPLGVSQLTSAVALHPDLAAGRANLVARPPAGDHVIAERAQEGSLGVEDHDSVGVVIAYVDIAGHVERDSGGVVECPAAPKERRKVPSAPKTEIRSLYHSAT